jgi:hypothetical protein
MPSSSTDSRTNDLSRVLDDAVNKYREDGDRAELLETLASLSAGRSASELIAAVEPHRHIPEIAGPLYEKIVSEQPGNARALVILANAYWLSGAGPEVVGELAGRALAADPDNRGAWHLWSLSESEPRGRCARWRHVVERFPDDDLARANLADNLASLAGGEHDDEALREAIAQFEILHARTTHPDQKASVARALETLKGWRL